MKKLCFIIVFFSIYGLLFSEDELNPPQNLRALSNLNSQVYLAWDTPLPPRHYTELANDDGIARGLDPAIYGDYLSARFTPATPCTLKSVKLFMYTPQPPDTIELHIWRNDPDGYPSLFVGDIITPRRYFVTASYNWVEIDLSSQNIYLNGDDFHIGIANVDSSFNFIMIDGGQTIPQRSFIFRASEWDFFPLSGDLMIRAMVKPIERTTSYPIQKQVHNFPTQLNPVVESLPLRERIMSSSVSLIHYNIYRSNSPYTGYYFITSIDTLFYTDYEVTNNNTYYYKVTAEYDEGESEYSNYIFATPRAGDGSVYDTLMYDSGVPSFAISWRPDCRFANKFNLPITSEIIGLDCFFYATGMIQPALYPVTDGVIGNTPIFILPTNDSIRTAGWHYIDLDRFDIFYSGDFLASINLRDASVSLGSASAPGTMFSYDYDIGAHLWSQLNDTIYFIRVITRYNNSNVRVELKTGWNMVSLPVVPSNRSFNAIFPNAIIAYTFNAETGTYVRADSLYEGRGYFVLSLTNRSYNISGLPIRNYDTQLYSGWNMIGSISTSDPIPTSNMTAFPSSVLADNRLFHYNTTSRNYTTSSNFYPGMGYWVLSNGTGILRVRIP